MGKSNVEPIRIAIECFREEWNFSIAEEWTGFGLKEADNRNSMGNLVQTLTFV